MNYLAKYRRYFYSEITKYRLLKSWVLWFYFNFGIYSTCNTSIIMVGLLYSCASEAADTDILIAQMLFPYSIRPE